MTLEQFAEKAGVTIINSPIGYGGPYGYIEYGRPNSSTHGFKTKDAAYKAWLLETFGKRVAKTVFKLLEESAK